jgi:ADP-ribosylglycohydrolase
MYNYGNATKFKEWVANKEREPYNSYGNGSAMRVIPVGWWACSLEQAAKFAKITAEITHNHPDGILGAQAVACTIWAIRNGYSKDEVKEWLEHECKYNLDISYDTLKRNHKFECTCPNSVPASFICWYNSTSYEDCVRKAVSLGGDADTEAAIAGAFAAADKNTPIPEELTTDVTRFFSMDFMEVLNKFHNQFEV